VTRGGIESDEAAWLREPHAIAAQGTSAFGRLKADRARQRLNPAAAETSFGFALLRHDFRDH